ncbi:hypothetical protein [Luteolibacter sp. Populi]|uniref:hypothetical protein n=1 Tax=Luteolibacter sp. Populi TaxID=3230487 RepID=UPI003465EE84
MKPHHLLAALCLASGAALAQTTQNYPDTTGEIAVGSFPHLDITSVDVTLDAAGENITFKINLNGSPVDTNWGKYMIGIRSNPGGTTTGSGWGRPITMAGGMTHWIGCYVDGSMGAEVYAYNGSIWTSRPAGTISKDASSVTVSTITASLNLSPGEVFSFDVYASGGGDHDSAVEALSSATASVGIWDAAYVTGLVGSTPRPALTFTMPGTPDYATWIAFYGLFDADALPGNDYDLDGLTNQQEFDLDIGLDPALADSDDDGLKDGEETLDGQYVDATHTGSNPMNPDSDGDGATDGDEVKQVAAAYVRDPNHYNYVKIAVPGTFNLPAAWDATGASVPGNEMSVAGTGLAQQFQYSLDHRFAVPKSPISHKFTAGTWDVNWGASGTAGVASQGGGNIDHIVAASGIYRFAFNTATRAYSFTRPSFADATAYLAAYGLATGADEDSDGLNNEAEFTANSDPYNADSDGDGLADDADPEPLVVAPESREVVFQVNMAVAISEGYFTPGTSVVRVIGQFAGWNTSGGVVLSDADADGIYTGSYTAGGFEGISFGNYKFFINGGPDGGYESGADRSFNLGPDGVQQLLPVVYYSNILPPVGFTAWIATFDGLADPSRDGDPDGDGISNETEFLFGTSPATGNGAVVTLSNGSGGLVLRWLQRSGGATYTLQENADLAGEWTTGPVTPATATDQDGVPADYTRMEAVIPTTSSRNLVRVNGTEN